ncbi:MAG TPA: Txe/YoeB family addiction module toxin [Rhodanobacteraceae bacterium]|nr:Txe/YoeB family addiction module toxin [Rhodanobacteraceae bacterium]
MARRLAFSPLAWDAYLHWQQQDRRILERINDLLQACARDPFTGIGKPEPLKRELAGCWSRRIDQAHRLVYRVDGDAIQVVSCRYHYEDR